MALSLDGSSSGNTVAVASPTLSLTTTTGSGEIVVVILTHSTVSSVTAPGLTFTARSAAQVTSGVNDFEEWVAPYSSNFSGTITINLNAALFTTATVFGIGGAALTSPFDSNVGCPGTSTSTTPTISTTNANDFIFTNNLCDGTGTGTASSGWTLINGSNFQIVQYQIVSAAQTNLTPGQIGGGNNVVGGSIDAIIQASAVDVLQAQIWM